jgi:cyanophycin synthetase
MIADAPSRAIALLSLYHRVAIRLDERIRGARRVLDNRRGFYTALWRDAAARAGAEVIELGASRLSIQCGSTRLLVSGNFTSLDDPVTLALAGDKPYVYGLLAEQGLPVPKHVACRYDDWPVAESALTSLGGPCVVKPALGGWAGKGITTGVAGRLALLQALAVAGASSEQVVVEREVEGDNYRLLYLDGELLDVVRREPPMLRGDGRSTIRELLRAENADRRTRGSAAAQTPLTVDADLRHTLRRQGYSLRSVPAAGVLVRAKTVVNDNRRESNASVNGILCGSIVEAGAAAAAVLGIRLAGVDVISRDPGRSLQDTGGVILEVNTNPGLYIHSTGEPVAVAAAILERLAGARR